MKRYSLKFLGMLLLVTMMSTVSYAQDDSKAKFYNTARYAAANEKLGAPTKKDKRVVLMGNSITEGWVSLHKDFFAQHPYLIGRGISGQTSYQMVGRFQSDVLNLKPAVVVINAGTNDVAENTCAYNEDKTFENIKSMVEMARKAKVKVVIASVLPSGGFSWRLTIKDAMPKIKHLNARLQEYAKSKKITYLDYFSAMVSADGKELNPDYARDKPGVHPNVKGYAVMEKLLLPAVEKLRK